MWYEFESDGLIGTPRVEEYQVVFYDMEQGSNAYDEIFYPPERLDKVIPFVETIEDKNRTDRSRVFVHFKDGAQYELKLEYIAPERKCYKFYE